MPKIKKVNLDSLKKTFELMDNDRGKLGLSILRELEFILKTLEQLKKEIIYRYSIALSSASGRRVD